DAVTPKARAASDSSDVPAVVGKVVAYEHDASLVLEIQSRDGAKKSEFTIVKKTTTIELPPPIRDIKVGQMLAVWPDKEDAKLAAKIGSPNAVAAAPTRRPSNQPATPGTRPGRSGNPSLTTPAPLNSAPLSPARRCEPGLTAAEV